MLQQERARVKGGAYENKEFLTSGQIINRFFLRCLLATSMDANKHTPRLQGRFLLPSRRQEPVGVLPYCPSVDLASCDLPMEYVEHAAKLQAREEAEAAAAERAAARCPVPVPLPSSRRPQQPSPRSRQQVARTAALLSSAAACEQLLRGRLSPSTFTECVLAMLPSSLEVWLCSFGACIARLGSTLQSLHAQLKRQLQSAKRSPLHEGTRQVLHEVDELEGSLDGLGAVTGEEVAAAARLGEECLNALVREARRREVVQRRWTRALLGGLVEARRSYALFTPLVHAVVDSLSAAHDNLAAAADAICLQAQRLLGCYEAALFISPPPASDTGAAGHKPLVRVKTANSSPDEIDCYSQQLLNAATSPPIDLKSIVGAVFQEGTGGVISLARAAQDHRYNDSVDRLPGFPPPQAALYINLSDDRGDVLAVLRCAQPWRFHARGGLFQLAREEALIAAAPLFTLALRCCLVGTPAVEAVSQASIMASIARPLALPTAASLREVVLSWASLCQELAAADRCIFYTYDAVTDSMSRRGLETPRAVSLDGVGETTLIGMCARIALLGWQ